MPRRHARFTAPMTQKAGAAIGPRRLSYRVFGPFVTGVQYDPGTPARAAF
ncbi:hypothetical protein GGD81_000815 [Rhodobium orientis]|nr:hypothetical protein [Rhodobium orientis]